jgi:ABC-type dipeptide/oligopeptide/nickel transport system permease component
VLRRSVSGAIVVFAVAVLAYGSYRGLRPELFPGEPWLTSTWHDVERALLHFDFGQACGWPGCPSIRTMWVRGAAADLWLLGGALAIGVAAGVGGGLWCARHARSFAARVIEGSGMLAICTPVYLVGLTSILLFNPAFGLLSVPKLFDATGNAYAAPWIDPWGWLQTLLIPWLVAAAPVAGYCLRATVALVLEELQSDPVRTARAKGLAASAVFRRHAAPQTYPATAGLIWGLAPTIVTNLVLVEWVFSVPGFFLNTKRALGKADPPVVDVPMLQAQAIWGAVLVVMLGALTDLVLLRLDPRVRRHGF